MNNNKFLENTEIQFDKTNYSLYVKLSASDSAVDIIMRS